MAEDRVPLDLLTPAVVRRRARMVMIGAVVVAAALGGVIGLLGGRLAGVLAALIVGLPLVLLAYAEGRKRVWLAGSTVSVRAFGTRSVDLHHTTRMELLVTEVRGNRTVGLLVGGPPRGKTINVAVASYAATAGQELNIVALRALADALAGGEDTRGLVYSELLVAQLRATARELPYQDRPLFRLASLAPAGHLAQRLHQDAVSRFVAALD